VLISHKLVVYLIISPLSNRDYDRFGIQRWLDRGWEVKVFDFTKFLKPEFWDYVDGTTLSIGFKGLNIFEDENSALSSIRQLKSGTVFIDIIHISRSEQNIRTTAKKKGIILKLKLGSLPVKQSDSSIFFNMVQKGIKDPFGFFPKFANKIRQFREEVPDYFVVGGNISQLNTSKGNPSIIKAHNFDYDFIIAENTTENDQKAGGIVFLDANEAYHSDFVSLGIKPYVTAANYYPVMSAGLSQIAEALSCDVKIAAHPRSDYAKKSYKYSYPILKDQTFELIKKASVVVSHGSTSLQWSVYMRKPIILVTTDEMNESIFRQTTEAFSLALGKDVVNLNRIAKNYDWKSQLFVDEEKYLNYFENYVKQAGTLEKPVWEIVIDRMELDLFHE
jgi:hypothetical protein